MQQIDTLNNMQRDAVQATDGPLLILAGAGSGKTRVITNRVAYLIENGVNPYHILAITFTNKAAAEMRERVDDIVGYGSESVWVSTFHSLCVRILRREIELLDYDSHFTIYDADDQKSVMKQIVKRMNLDNKMFPEKQLISHISKAKEQFISVKQYTKEARGDFHKEKIAEVYGIYEETLKNNQALDFDDLIFKTVELFQFYPDVLERYQDRFRYIMVDEYQDTNHVQFLLISQLARKYQNLCVVGDDDQSIYKFRGANIYNILNFEQEYPETMVVRLEQNYRSTGNILKAANAVIHNNKGRKDKSLWTQQPDGEKLVFHQYDSDYVEAEQTVSTIRALHENGNAYGDMAILYRTNAQSRMFEEKLILSNVPYKLVGGVNFYARKEIKDLICYLKAVENGADDLCVQRIVNVPKRGIGATSMEKASAYAYQHGMSLLDALFEVEQIPSLSRAASKIQGFTRLIQDFRDELMTGESLSMLFQNILDATGYLEELELEGTPESEARIENIEELKNKIVQYEEESEEPSLSGLLEEIALVADIDSVDEDDDKVVLMTLHSAKGLEFPCVFLVGMEEGIFPSAMVIYSENMDEEIEEERRLCYVGITRAKKRLFLSAAKQRMMRGNIQVNAISRFVGEIPDEIMDVAGNAVKRDQRANRPEQTNVSKVFTAAPAYGRSFGTPQAVKVNYQIGDRVRHIKFGEGVVTGLVAGGKDYEVTVDFDRVGTKKMFASFAKLIRV